MSKSENLIQLSGSPGCFICDNNNSNTRALGLKIMWDNDNKTVHIPFVPDPTWCGYSNVVHGGLVASVLDEAMAWAVEQVSGDWAFTVDFHLRYKKAVEPGKNYVAIASVKELGRKITVQAELFDADGKIVAVASAIFLPARGKAKPQTDRDTSA